MVESCSLHNTCWWSNAQHQQGRETDYAGEFVYENDVLQLINHEEGRIMVSSQKEIVMHAGDNLVNVAPSGGATVSTETVGSDTYVKVIPQTGVALGGQGLQIGGTIPVAAGERYKFRVKGYNSIPSSAYLWVQRNGSDFIWFGPEMPYLKSREMFSEVIFTVPAGTTSLTFGVRFSGQNIATATDRLYINDLEVIKLETTTPEYQYNLKDHLGNVRLTFTTKQETESATATLETASANTEAGKFLHYNEAIKVNHAIWDHTNSGATTYATRLTGANTNAVYGLAKSLSVMPGDVVNMEVYAKYLDTNTTNWTTALNNFIASITGGTAPAGTFVDGGAAGSLGSGTFPITPINHTAETGTPPKAYLNYIVFNKDMTTVLNSGFSRITTNSREYGQDCAHDLLSLTYTVKEPGYIYIYLSNENATAVEVYFDDFKVDHVKSPVIQMDDYYAFGLQFNSYNRENSVANQYLYNGKEKQDELNLGWMDYGARMYISEIGRWGVMDPLTEVMSNLSPYHYVRNNPITRIDPNGMYDVTISGIELEGKEKRQAQRALNKMLFSSQKSSGKTDKSSENGDNKDGGSFGVMSSFSSGFASYQNQLRREDPNRKSEQQAQSDPPYGPWDSYIDFWKSMLRVDAKDWPGVIIVGRGSEEFGLRKLGNGKYGVWRIDDPNHVMNILSFTSVNGLLDAGFAAMGVWDEDPRNAYIGPWLPSERIYLWKEITEENWNAWHPSENFPGSGHYRYLYSDDKLLYMHSRGPDGTHIMTQTKIKY